MKEYTTPDMGTDKCFLNDEGVIEIYLNRDYTTESNAAMAAGVEPAAISLIATGKPLLIMTIIGPESKITPFGMRAAYEDMKSTPVNKRAIVVPKSMTKLNNLANMISELFVEKGEGDQLQVFDTREAAIKWLLTKASAA